MWKDDYVKISHKSMYMLDHNVVKLAYLISWIMNNIVGTICKQNNCLGAIGKIDK